MANAPDVVIVARHGARLDAADKSWHLTSPTPYDPPLTYGGWNQSKALGSRIANLLQTRVEYQAAAGGGECENPDWRRKYRVVIHSSPFLRCIQTSVAIGAGMAEYVDVKGRGEHIRSHVRSERRRSKTGIEEEEEDFHEAEAADSRAALRKVLKQQNTPKATLRIDAFLGEWLTPDYYEEITPPPGSTMMVAGAKADLLRNEPIDVFQPGATAKGYFPGGWSGQSGPLHKIPGRLPSPTRDDHSMSATPPAKSMPRSYRASSHSSVESSASRRSHRSPKDVYSSLLTSRNTYISPVPAYAISPTQPIPRGYVTHAKDACIDVDFQWDSMRPPQDWGDGGEYGEEWSAMHKRFRLGLHRLISWYKEQGTGRTRDDDAATSSPTSADGNGNRDLVVILVTHGAGCNALIGGITNQPVLMDVGLASLTMAVRRRSEDNHISSPVKNGAESALPLGRRSLIDYGLSGEYEMQLTASTDHLRAGTEASNASALHSPNLVARIPEYNRSAHGESDPSTSAVSANGQAREAARPVNSSLGSIRRSTMISGSSSGRYSSISPSRSSTASMSASGSGSGLWSKNMTTDSSFDGTTDYAAGQLDQLSLGPAVTANSVVESPIDSTDSSRETATALPISIPSRSLSQHGLWTPKATAACRGLHESGSKRRWTVNDHDG